MQETGLTLCYLCRVQEGSQKPQKLQYCLSVEGYYEYIHNYNIVTQWLKAEIVEPEEAPITSQRPVNTQAIARQQQTK
jgi:hypothetical protein